MTIWTNGCFDIIHAGHISLLEYAKSLGDYLVVGVDVDERVRLSKGPQRPVNTLENRVKVLSAIKFVDKVVTFGSDAELIERLKEVHADLIVIGDDYDGKRVVGSQDVPVKFFPRIPNLSTTRSVNALRV